MVHKYIFLAALSSSRSLVIGRSVRPSVGRSIMFVKKLPLKYCKVIKTFLIPTYDTVETVVTFATVVTLVTTETGVTVVTKNW